MYSGIITVRVISTARTGISPLSSISPISYCGFGSVNLIPYANNDSYATTPSPHNSVPNFCSLPPVPLILAVSDEATTTSTPLNSNTRSCGLNSFPVISSVCTNTPVLSNPYNSNCRFSNMSTNIKLKHLEIHIFKNLRIDQRRKHDSRAITGNLASRRAVRKQNLFNEGENSIFQGVFSDFIHHQQYIHINKQDVIYRAYNSEAFAPILSNLYQRFSEDVVER